MGLQEYTSGSGTFTATVTGNHTIYLVGGGGGAGDKGGANGEAGGGGGGGSFCKKVVSLVASQGYSYAVGAAGIVDGNGGDSTFNDGATTYTAGDALRPSLKCLNRPSGTRAPLGYPPSDASLKALRCLAPLPRRALATSGSAASPTPHRAR